MVRWGNRWYLDKRPGSGSPCGSLWPCHRKQTLTNKAGELDLCFDCAVASAFVLNIRGGGLA